MAVKIRMKRMGRTNRPEFRIVAADARSPRDGSILENLGFYHPLEKDETKVLRMNEDRIRYWLSVGAQPSETLVSFFKKRGIALPWVENEKARRAKEAAERRAKKGKPAREKKKGAPKPAAAKAEAAAAATAASAEAKAEAAKSKAAKREAKKAK